MKHNKAEKAAADIIMLLCGAIFIILLFYIPWNESWSPVFLGFALVFLLFVLMDLCRLFLIREKEMSCEPDFSAVFQLILLDEYDKPVKSWDMTGRISLVIGRAGREAEVDVDLQDCEYSSFIDCQHAALNFSQDCWYVEDLGSRNGVKVRKVEDGQCYRVMGRPCRLSAGDVLYIANTRLLLS